MPADTPAGYLDENGVPVVWDNPQAAALDWQEAVKVAQAHGEDLPSLQTWPNGLPPAYGILDRSLMDVYDPWDGYHRMGPGYSELPVARPVVTALGPRLQAMQQRRIPF